ncbi:MAG TPA: STAS domain-containing protein [Bryobacteraceae bacterium]
MALTIATRMEDGLAVLELNGSLTLGPSLVSLRNAAREVLATPKLAGIILDVHQITSVDSSGLGELTIVYSSASRHNVPLRLVGVSANLQKMLQMTHLDGVLQSAGELAAAKRQLSAR